MYFFMMLWMKGNLDFKIRKGSCSEFEMGIFIKVVMNFVMKLNLINLFCIIGEEWRIDR